VLLPWAGHFISILCVSIGIYYRQKLLNGRLMRNPIAWLALLGIALDPFLLFHSRMLWADTLIGGLSALAMTLVIFCR
jgi:hypothetical protein